MAVLLSVLLSACQKAGQAPAPTFAIAPQAASLTVRFSGYHTTYLVPHNWDTAEGILTNSDPAIASSTVRVTASNSGSALAATLSFANVKPASGYSLEVELLNTQEAQPAIIASETQGGIALTPGANTLTFAEPQSMPSITPTQAFGPYVVSLPGFGTAGRLANAQDLAVDSKGRYLVLDNGRLRLIQPDALGRLSISTLAGQNEISSLNVPGQGAVGFVDGPGETALFNNPRRLTIASDGSIYIADTNNNAIRKVTLDAKDTATVSTVAGNGAAGNLDGQGVAAEFNAPWGLALDNQGNLYVADTGNNLIRMVSPTGLVSTIAGNGTAGYQDGPAANAEFHAPQALALDVQGRLWVADKYNKRIRMIAKEPSGAYVVSTVAGNGTYGYVDGAGTSAEFSYIVDLAFTPQGDLDVLDLHLRQLTFDASGTATVATLAGNGNGSNADGPVTSIGFAYPGDVALTMDPSGNPLLLSPHTIVRMAPDSTGVLQFKKLFGDYQQFYQDYSPVDGPARYDYDFTPQDFAMDKATGDVYVATKENQILEIPAAKTDASPVLVAGNGVAGRIDGPGATAELANPGGIAIGKDGALYVADTGDNTIRRIAKDSSGQYVVSTYAGGVGGYQDGPASTARFDGPYFVTWGPDDALYVSDTGTNTIRKIAPDSTGQLVVSTVVGAFASGLVDGSAANARFWGPTGIAFDKQGNLIVADSTNCCVRKVTFDASGNAATVSTIAGSGQPGYQDGLGKSATFIDPHEVSVAANGDIYVIDQYRVRKISFGASGDGAVTTVAGADMGFVDGPGPAARFGQLAGMMLDGDGNLLLADYGNRVVRKLIL
ncbi:MAG TPA: hypothetical protein V6D47_07945 [Oscillatoriaceae cyanobacterium]